MHNGTDILWQDRYSRQTKFAPIGPHGQVEFQQSCVLIVGCGALGSSLAQHMVRAGVGEVRIIDRDFVEPSNLQRQVLFNEADALAAVPKAVAASEKLRLINSQIQIVAHVADVNAHTAWHFAKGADIVLDGTDNAATRLLLSDVCYGLNIPFVYGGVTGSNGMSAMLVPGKTACLRCLIGEEHSTDEGDNCSTVGVLSPAVEFVASLQTIEVLKWLSGNRDALRQSLVSADLWKFNFHESSLPAPSNQCSHCGDTAARNNRKVGASEGRIAPIKMESTVVLCGRDSVQVTLPHQIELDLMRRKLEGMDCELTVNRYLVKASLRSGESLVLFPDGRVLVQGVVDSAKAIQLCEHYLLGELIR
ncbi:ThiF family adenylyltransferase [Paenibacillus sp. L3-i20]|uniref:ThiF family adenylyltransferase n=1 Tax=Paenibacillus sp. L3-i20 TaxID=2905833 RepID=UPI001EDE2E7A|nr:ThiF family adenylyltransferase [Paenibacillus sp. L3-i20]GKU80202.1 thiamine/molybdopterin biosynthesis protein MoeB [Paenibacillus sp. L3-i20]